MIELRYPSRSLMGDWIRTGIGLAIGLGVLASIAWSTWILIVFGGITALFLFFGYRTLERQLQVVALGEEGVIARDLRQRVLPWSAIEDLRLRFYGTRRQHRRLGEGEENGGFLQLTLTSPRTKLVFESSLAGFSLLAWRAAQAARDRQLKLDPTSAGNLLTLGIDPDKDTMPPEMAAEWTETVARS